MLKRLVEAMMDSNLIPNVTRAKCCTLIQEGRVSVNGDVINTPMMVIDSEDILKINLNKDDNDG